MPTGQWFGMDRLFRVFVPRLQIGRPQTTRQRPAASQFRLEVNKGFAMQLTPEQIQIGSENFNRVSSGLNDSDVSRRDFLKAAAAGAVGLGAAYFGYKKLEGDAVRVGFIGTGDEGNILLTQHPPEYMNIVAIADIRPSNRLRAFVGDGNDDRMGLIRKLGEETASKIKQYNDHRELLADKSIEAVVIAVPLNQHGPFVMDALNAGKHVLTEKLMAHDITQCKQMIRKAKDKEAAAGRRASAALQRAVRQRQPHRPRGTAGRRQVHPRPMAPQ